LQSQKIFRSQYSQNCKFLGQKIGSRCDEFIFVVESEAEVSTPQPGAGDKQTSRKRTKGIVE